MSDVTETTVNLTWSPPEDLGVPELSFYLIILSPSSFSYSDTMLTTNLTSSIISGLAPATQYYTTVTGVSLMNNVESLGEKSHAIAFKTITGGKRLRIIYCNSKNVLYF